MGDIEALTDRIFLIGKGQILFDGSFNNLKSRYNSYSILTVDYSGENIISNLFFHAFCSGTMVFQSINQQVLSIRLIIQKDIK